MYSETTLITGASSGIGLHHQFAAHGHPLILVRHAGHGRKGKAWEIPIECDIPMRRPNVEAILRLNKALTDDVPPERQNRQRGDKETIP